MPALRQLGLLKRREDRRRLAQLREKARRLPELGIKGALDFRPPRTREARVQRLQQARQLGEAERGELLGGQMSALAGRSSVPSDLERG